MECYGKKSNISDVSIEFTKEPVIVIPFTTGVSNRVLAFNRDTKVCNSIPLSIDQCIDTPIFVPQMNDSLFTHIEGVVDINTTDRRGYLILFQINGRPKYCFTSEGKNISEEV